MTAPPSVRSKRLTGRRVSFSVRTLVVVVTVLCLGLGWIVYRAERQRHAVEQIERGGGRVYYPFQQKTTSPRGVGTQYSRDIGTPLSFVLRRMNGLHYWCRPIYVDVGVTREPVTQEVMAALASLPSVEHVVFSDAPWTDGELKLLQEMKRLRFLEINSDRLTNDNLALIAPIPALEELSIMTKNVDEHGLENLRSARGLKFLVISIPGCYSFSLTRFERQHPGCRLLMFE